MWYVMCTRNSNSIMSINHLLLNFICLLLLLPRTRRTGDSGVCTPEIPVVSPRRIRCCYLGDSGPKKNGFNKTFWILLRVITLWGSIMLCAYYKPRKCEYWRLCHLELILEIIFFPCGMFAQTSSITC